VTDNLARRMADNQIGMAADSLARDADRLAATARQYATDLRGNGGRSGGAYQLAQQTADLLRQAARLDGMRDIAALLPDKETP
jgi:hypothetical protein